MLVSHHCYVGYDCIILAPHPLLRGPEYRKLAPHPPQLSSRGTPLQNAGFTPTTPGPLMPPGSIVI